MPSSTPFSTTALDATLSDVGSSALLVQMVSEAITMQPNVSTSSVPSLPDDQQAVQQLAVSGISTAASMMGLSALVLGYANKFLAMYDDLLMLAERIDNPDTNPAVRTAETGSFVNGLSSLTRTIGHDRDDLEAVGNELTALSAQAIPAQAAMDADLLAVQTNLADSEIPALEAQLTTIQQSIDADNQIIAKATMHDLVDGIKMIIAIYDMGTEDGDFKGGLKSLVGVVQDMANTSNAIQEATHDVNQQLALYQQTLEQLTADQLTWAVVQNLDANTDLLVSYLAQAIEATTAYANAWQSQYDDLNTLADTLNDPGSPQPVLTNYLTPDVQTDWINLRGKATAMQVVPLVTLMTVGSTQPTNILPA